MPPASRTSMPWDTHQELEEPLLPSRGRPPNPSLQQHQPGTQHSKQAARPGDPRSRSSKEGPKQQTVDLGSRFLRRLCVILRIISATPALSLVVLSLAETVIVSKIGTISGLFYQVFVDGQASRVPQLMLWSAGCYTATALFYSFKAGLQDFFAWRWRASLTVHLQRVYCSNVGTICARSQAPLLQSLDSPDQRVAQDLPLLTASLAEVLTQLAAVPFNIVWYTYLTRQVFGSWLPVLCAYLFFLLGLLLQRLVMLPVAAAVFQQEAAEGAFRYGHTRFRAWASEIAMYRSEPLEQAHLEGQLSRVLVYQGRLLLRRAVVTATSRLLDYGGLVVNFGCLAAAVFGGAWSGQGQSAGDIASKVSIASFYLLTLIYNFSQVLDLASKVANLAGLTARVSQMLEALPQQQQTSTSTRPASAACHGQQQQHTTRSNRKPSIKHAVAGFGYDCPADALQTTHQQLQQQPHSPRQQPLQEVAAGRSPSHQRYASQAVLLQAPQLLLLPPAPGSRGPHEFRPEQPVIANSTTTSSSSSSSSSNSNGLPHQGSVSQGLEAASAACPAEVMQVSIHSMGADMLLQEVRTAFPDSPRLAPLLAVVTFQFCRGARDRMLLKQQQQQQQQQQQGGGQQHHQHSQQSRRRLLLPPPITQQQHVAVRGSSSEGCCSPCASASGGGCAGAGTDGAGSGSGSLQGLCGDADMQHMLDVFLSWQQAVYDHITSSGYWCDTIDPRTGTALHGTPGSPYDEVIGASVLLGYDQVTPAGQSFVLISHPDAATQVYPATLFTSAPLPVLREALRAAAGDQGAAPALPSPATAAAAAAAGTTSSQAAEQQPGIPWLDLMQTPRVEQLPPALQQAGQQQQLLLSCSGVSLRTPAGVPVVQGLTLQLPAAGSLLIQGPSGCGKSTLVSCLAGLWPLDSGSVSLGAGVEGMLGDAASGGGAVGVMFVPQRPLAAPGITLRQQLLYPAARSLWPCTCSNTCRAGSGPQAQQEEGLKGRRQQRQRRWGVSRSWWLNWLSCGLHQQQHAGLPAQDAPTWPAPRMAQKQQQQQLSLPALPPPAHPHLCQQLHGHHHHQQQQQQQLGLVGMCPGCQHLVSVLQRVGLTYLLSAHPMGLHSRHEAWGDVLSPGELQRLSFARVLLHQPRLAVLDEATSALPDAAAVELYQQLQGAGVSYVSVGHSRCLVGVHAQVLSVVGDGSGGWQLG